MYRYGTVTNIPDGITVRDAREVLPGDDFLTHKRTGSPALHSDLFRYRMLAQGDNMVWADTDAYCVKPFVTNEGHLYGWESEKQVAAGVLGFPSDSATLQKLIAFTDDEYSIPTWYGEDYTRELEAAKAKGTPIHASEQPWGVWGPHALNHFLHETGEVKYALPPEALYPFPYVDRRKMLRPDIDSARWLTDNTLSIHFYGRRIRQRIINRYNGLPPEDSLIGQLLIKHGVEPEDAPIPVSKGSD